MRTLIATAVGLMVGATALDTSALPLAGDGQTRTEARDVASFDAIRLETMADVAVKVGSPLRVEVTADGNLLSHVKTEIRSGVLVIDTDQHLRPKVPLKVEVSVPELRKLELDGSGDVTIDGGRGDLEIAVQGAGDVRWTGTAGKLKASIAGSGDVALAGTAADLAVDIEGSGDVDARQLEARNANVDIEGSGDVRVHLGGGKLRAAVTGSGSVEWSGIGAVERSVAVGSGHITRVEGTR